MKRGWIFWDKKALSPEELARRIKDFRERMQSRGCDAVIVYGDANQSGNLSHLTHFFPYADTGAFVLPSAGAPRLFTTHAYRNMPWFRTISWVEDICCTNAIGAECAGFLEALKPPPRKIGIVDLRTFPFAIYEETQRRLSCGFVDMTDDYQSLRIKKSEAELGYVQKAAEIAAKSFAELAAALRPGWSGFDIAAELELAARRMGAADLFCFIQPDGSPEGLTWPDARAFDRSVSVDIAVEFGGLWARLGGTFVPEPAPKLVRSRIDQCAAVFDDLHETKFSNQKFGAFAGFLEDRLEKIDGVSRSSLLFNPGLEPYWGGELMESRWEASRLDDHAVLFLQAALDFDDGFRLLRTETLIVRHSGLNRAAPFDDPGLFQYSS